MNKEKIIKESKDFTEIIQKKQSIKNKYFSIFYTATDNNKYGISIPKKIGKANVRNKIKRRIKNIIITNENYIQKGFSYVIITKEAIISLTYEEMAKELLELFKKVVK